MQTTLQGGTAAVSSSGVLAVIIGAECQRHGIVMPDAELVAITAILTPVVHTFGVMFPILIKKWTGIDITDPKQ